ncbi:MAG: FliI/YscN family ATPase [Desulfobacteraceae bacterium]|nr:MAG: FliI/YscN family ATPase [Desulfobacteraceae bacterium]
MAMGERSVKINWNKYTESVKDCRSLRLQGRIVKLAGIVAEANGPGLSVGSLCKIETTPGNDISAEVVGFKDQRLFLMPFGELRGVKPGSRVVGISNHPTVPVGNAYLGRVVDGLGCPIDGKGVIKPDDAYSTYGNVHNPLKRGIIREVMDVGIRAINTLITVGKGQRIAVMAGSGVGKSVLLGMMARNTAADVSIIALIGERGREVRYFIEKNLGDAGMKKSIVVASTSDAPALERIRAAYLATALAEYFRDKGLDVLLVMDSVTRVAMSLREVGLAAGEPPTAKGYTPSVFSQLPKLLERAGNIEKKGSITGIYNVLVEGDDMSEPIADTVRSIVDGHIVLSRSIAHRGHYPAIDVMASISRVMKDIVGQEHLDIAKKLIKTIAAYRDAEDLINIGAYSDGSDPNIDYAKRMIGKINTFLQQDIDQKEDFNESITRLKLLFEEN